MKKINVLMLLLMGFLLVLPQSTNAQIQNTASTNSAVCLDTQEFNTNLYYGLRSADVVRLQNFLKAQGYLNAAQVSTGLYGNLTLQAVKKFQQANAISTTGYFGILSRGKAKEIVSSCAPVVPQSTVTLDSITPSSVEAGSMVTLKGNNFATSSNLISFGSHEVAIVDATSSTTIQFIVPTNLNTCPGKNICTALYLYAAGDWDVTVKNVNGTSNSVKLHVTQNE